MVRRRSSLSAGVRYSWTPEVAWPYGKGKKPCNQSDPDVMFPDPADSDGVAFAKVICGFCDARDACLAEALRHSPTKDYGVWGGTTEAERRAIRRRNRQSQRKVEQPAVRPRPASTRPRSIRGRWRWAGPTHTRPRSCQYRAA